ncbi:hypothetical protein [Salinibius halmophilus]|uniref:hypothetical protein n=1 Tax=Salinibius halmophilus TaxID=1853216 RepID=UPI001314E90E|nr:hypothetical protein [Salinibius halmophilus]
MRWIIIITAGLLIAGGVWFSQSQPAVVVTTNSTSQVQINNVIATLPPVALPIPEQRPAQTQELTRSMPVLPTPTRLPKPVEPAEMTKADQLNELLAQTVALDETGNAYRAIWREIWPLSRQRGVFEQAPTTISLIQQGLTKHGWRNGNTYLALAAQMQAPQALGPVLSTYWQAQDALDAQNWRSQLQTLALIQAGDKESYLGETQAFCSDLRRISELAMASCFGSLLNGFSVVLQLQNLKDPEAVIALVQQALSQPENITLNLLRAIEQIQLPGSSEQLLKVAVVQALANLPIEYLRQEPLASFVQSFDSPDYQLANLGVSEQDDLLDALSIDLHEYHRLYVLAATTAGVNLTDNWLDRASQISVELMLFGKDMILTAYQNPEQNKLTDDLNRYALKLYQHPRILQAMRDGVQYCLANNQADEIALQLMDLVTFQSPGRDSDFNQLYQQLVQCHNYPS